MTNIEYFDQFPEIAAARESRESRNLYLGRASYAFLVNFMSDRQNDWLLHCIVDNEDIAASWVKATDATAKAPSLLRSPSGYSHPTFQTFIKAAFLLSLENYLLMEVREEAMNVRGHDIEEYDFNEILYETKASDLAEAIANGLRPVCGGTKDWVIDEAAIRIVDLVRQDFMTALDCPGFWA